MTKDTVIVPISDMHSGGSTALFPDRMWQFEHANVSPKDNQVAMFEHWTKCAEAIKRARKRRNLIIVHNGDAIEGWHHNTQQVMTMIKNEQIEIHIELMKYFLRMVDFNSDDRLYYVKGTEAHTESAENKIAKDLKAVFCTDESPAYDELKLSINGREVWFLHHGPRPGKGANRGNGLRNWLRNVFFDCVAEGIIPPDYIITAHTHDPDWNDYIGRIDGKYHKIHALICPSWQQKTRYAYGAAPLKKNKIGLQYFMITRDGIISDPVEMVMR